jgi:hypothetical protein
LTKRLSLPATLALTATLLLSACGGSSHTQKKAPDAKALITQACNGHLADVGILAATITDYKLYEQFGGAAALAPLAPKVATAITAIRQSSGAAASTKAGKQFFLILGEIHSYLAGPPARQIMGVFLKGWTQEAASMGCAIGVTTAPNIPATVPQTVTQQAATNQPTDDYPASFSNAFLKSCEANVSGAATCECALSYIESHSSPAKALAAFSSSVAEATRLITGALGSCEDK